MFGGPGLVRGGWRGRQRPGGRKGPITTLGPWASHAGVGAPGVWEAEWLLRCVFLKGFSHNMIQEGKKGGGGTVRQQQGRQKRGRT